MLDRLKPRPGKRITTVIAPAGYGKTTLVNQWCEQDGGTIAWLSLDAGDDEPRRFWQYVAGAIERQKIADISDARKRINDLSEQEFDGAITALINALAERDDNAAVLVLDDYHLIKRPDIHWQLGYFIDYLPPQFQVVLISRTEPPLPLARWRVRHSLDEVHAADLAFSESECQSFFNDYMGLALTPEQATQLWQRTEGWVAAMQLAALSGSHDDRLKNTESLIRYGGGDKYISDYVLSEILDHQAPEIRQFLLETACCLRLCGPLCDGIREATNSQGILETLVAANLFIIPLDTRGEWFRYHDLFREALYNRLKQTDSQRIDQLQQRAVDWFLEHDQLQEAIAQLVQLEDWEWLAKVLEQYGNNLIHGGYHLPVLGWMDRMPVSLTESRPRLLMLRIWALFFSNKLDIVEPLLERLESLLHKRIAEDHPDTDGAMALQSEIALIRSYLARTRSDLQKASVLTQQVLRDIDHTNIPLKSVTYYGIGLDCYARGDLVSARTALQSSVDHGKAEKKHSTVLSSGGLLAWILFHQGEMDLALELCASVRAWVDSYHTDPSQPRLVSCWQNSALIQIYRERNDLSLAQTYLNPLLDHVKKGTEPGQHIIIQYMRAHLAFSQENYEEAIAYLEDAENVLTHKRDVIVFEPPSVDALKARCFMAMGQLDKATAWLRRREEQTYQNPLNREQSLITAARVMLATQRPEDALNILIPLRTETEQSQHNKHLIELLAVYATACHLKGDEAEAVATMQQALRLAARDRLLRLFVDEGEATAHLIRHSDTRDLPDSYMAELHRLLDERYSPESSQPVGEPKPATAVIGCAELVEPLSQRELEVLELINAGLANKEIALKLDVAPTTIKAHIRNLYGKIGARSRTEALAKARQLGVLS
ncbi:LuxR C-terminal-related transcriptional regulator [Mangrovitalea sediminis]|uniref:LuxR C-terminal-related transcriptional regulator n=1 Tax=Mangrovitalea sediminis TaxID=1982043 RepID=UPI001D0D13E4|nr:LuxR C-terminal-related transcriptional regulator [Mangrovitalea sediminis]